MLLRVTRRRSKSRIANITSHKPTVRQTTTILSHITGHLFGPWKVQGIPHGNGEAIPAQRTYPGCQNTLEEVI